MFITDEGPIILYVTFLLKLSIPRNKKIQKANTMPFLKGAELYSLRLQLCSSDFCGK